MLECSRTCTASGGGEAVALRQDRVDVLRGSLRVTESLSDVGGTLHFGPTKNNRTVTLPREVSSHEAPEQCTVVSYLEVDKFVDDHLCTFARWFGQKIRVEREPGVGKTAIVEGLAQRIVDNTVPEGFDDRLHLLVAAETFADTEIVAAGLSDERLKADPKRFEILDDAGDVLGIERQCLRQVFEDADVVAYRLVQTHAVQDRSAEPSEQLLGDDEDPRRLIGPAERLAHGPLCIIGEVPAGQIGQTVVRSLGDRRRPL